MKWRAKLWDILLFFLFVLVAAVFWQKYSHSETKRNPTSTQTSSSTIAPSVVDRSGLEYLKTTKEVDVFRQLSRDDQNFLLAAVKKHCIKDYHAKSCIHHYLTCGKVCVNFLPRSAKRKIVADYDRWRQGKEFH